MSIFRKIHFLLSEAERRGAIVLLGFMFVGMVFETLGVGLVVPAVALMTGGDVANQYPSLRPVLQFLGNPTQAQLITGALVGFVGVYLIKNLFLAFLVWQQARFAFGIQRHLSQHLFTAYLRKPYFFHLQRNSAQLLRNVIGEVSLFTGAVSSTLNIITEALVLLGIVCLLLAVEPMGAIIVALVLGIAAWGFYRINRARITRWGAARQYHEGMRMQHLQQGLGGIKDVKLLGRETDFLEQYQIHNSQSAQVAQHQATLQQLPRLWLEVLAVAGLVTLVLIMLNRGLDMAKILPALALFAAAAFRLMPSVNRVLGAMQNLRYGLPVINTLYEELKSGVQDAMPRTTDSNLVFRQEICLVNVEITYQGAVVPALKNLSLNIKKGEFIGFIGTSGSGKSTLIDVILGLLPCGSGSIEVDGLDIQKNLRGWQDQIGYVPQTIYLTDDTLRRNIAFGLPDEEIDDNAVKRAVEAAQLEKFIATLPDGLETVVGERGIRLSGGQRQRIGIARALYHDPSVLVLDEATSALDAATECSVMRAVTALQGTKTLIIVAHRTSTVEQCDRLYRLEHGEVIAEGTPLQVLEGGSTPPAKQYKNKKA